MSTAREWVDKMEDQIEKLLQKSRNGKFKRIIERGEREEQLGSRLRKRGVCGAKWLSEEVVVCWSSGVVCWDWGWVCRHPWHWHAYLFSQQTMRKSSRKCQTSP